MESERVTRRPGRRSIFGTIEGGTRIQGILTAEGFAKLEEHREALRALVVMATGKEPGAISDANVVEYLARGREATLKVLWPD